MTHMTFGMILLHVRSLPTTLKLLADAGCLSDGCSSPSATCLQLLYNDHSPMENHHLVRTRRDTGATGFRAQA